MLTYVLQNFVTTRTNEEIYRSLTRGLRAASGATGGNFRHFAGSESMILEFAPLINRIIAPPLRPVRTTIHSPRERRGLNPCFCHIGQQPGHQARGEGTPQQAS